MDRSELVEKIKKIRILTEECLSELDAQGDSKKKAAKRSKLNRSAPRFSIDFDMPLRPFIKKHSKGLSGSRKFVLILSHLAKGDLKRQISLAEIKKQWNKMSGKSLIGLDFNTYYPTEAKDNDWVESKKAGFYNLRPSWEKVFRS